jgi:hypothetical protein
MLYLYLSVDRQLSYEAFPGSKVGINFVLSNSLPIPDLRYFSRDRASNLDVYLNNPLNLPNLHNL